MRVLILSRRDVLAALTPRDCAEAMAEVLAAQARGETCLPLRSLMVPPGAAGFMGLMPSWRGAHGGHGGQDGRDDGAAAFALKALCLMPGNPARGLDTHQGTVTLFDGETGVPTAILDASAVTAVRTAAVTAVATGLLARPGARALAILGAGVQGRAHLRALATVRGFERISVYAPTQAHASALIEQAIAADSEPGAELSVAPSAEDAVRGADVVVTATSAREPVLARSWLKPGAHVNAVGASTPAAREIDTATVAASALFCDSRESLRHEAGEFRLAIAEGAITGEEHVRAELGEVLAGTAPGRRDDGELTLFRSLGIAIEDLAAAQAAVAAARARGLGTEVEL
jgi:ornithine cyclodeaminase